MTPVTPPIETQSVAHTAISEPDVPVSAADGVLIAEDGSVDVLRVIAIFTAEWRVGLITAVVVFLIGAAYVVHLPSRYVADTLLLPKNASAAGGGGLSALFSIVQPASPYTTLLTSRGLEDDVVRRANLMPLFHTQSMEAARGALSAMTQIIPGTDGTYTIRVRDESATEAARIANTYVEALRALQESMALQQAEVQRRFFEVQLQREKDALVIAEQDLERTQEGSGVIDVGAQTSIGLSTIAGLRSQVTSLNVRLAALLQSETEQNPEVQTLRSQIAQLQVQERAQEMQGGGNSPVGAAGPASRMPKVNLEYGRKQREVQYHLGLVTSLASHFEDLRLGEGSIGDNFDVIDRAIVPEAPTWPPRRMYLLFAGALSILLGLFAIAIAVAVRRLAADAQHRANLRLIAHSVRGRR